MDAVDKELQAEYARVLDPSFWDHRSRWPRGGRTYIFLGEAIEEVGRAQFGEKWTGAELQACDFTPDFPSFDRYLEILAVTDAFDQQTAWLQRREGWEEVKASRKVNFERLMWCINWIGEVARDNVLETVLRVVDTDGVGARFYTPPNNDLWNVEPLLDRRFHSGHFDWWPPVPSDNLNSVFAFFTRESFDRALSSIGSTSLPVAYADLSILSPRLKFAVDYAIRVNADAKWDAPPIKVLKHMIEKAWEEEHGTKMSASSAEDIARLIKHTK